MDNNLPLESTLSSAHAAIDSALCVKPDVGLHITSVSISQLGSSQPTNDGDLCGFDKVARSPMHDQIDVTLEKLVQISLSERFSMLPSLECRTEDLDNKLATEFDSVEWDATKTEIDVMATATIKLSERFTKINETFYKEIMEEDDEHIPLFERTESKNNKEHVIKNNEEKNMKSNSASPMKDHNYSQHAVELVTQKRHQKEDLGCKITNTDYLESFHTVPVLSTDINESSNDEEDDEDDHDLLDSAPVFLQVMNNIAETPVSHIGSQSNSESLDEYVADDASGPRLCDQISKCRHTLDGLLEEHSNNLEKQVEIDDINKQLQQELQLGGFVSYLNRDDSQDEYKLPAEQVKVLNHFNIVESCIVDERPGTVVFNPANYECLFNNHIHPTHCGFTAGNGLKLEKHIQSLSPDDYRRLLMSRILVLCFHRISHQSQLLRWVFLLMSIDQDETVQESCKNVLISILHQQHLRGLKKWTPTLTDVLSVFVNFGADLNCLVPSELSPGTLFREKPDYHRAASQRVSQSKYHKENLLLVLQVLAQSLHKHKGTLSGSELIVLIVALCKASLDVSLKHSCAVGHFQDAVTMAILHFTDIDWMMERVRLCRLLAHVTDHHHNHIEIIQLLHGTRGSYLRHRVSYLVLNKLLCNNLNIGDAGIDNFQIKDVFPLIPFIRQTFETDLYRTSSVFTLLDLCVGNNADVEQLKKLHELVKRIRVRENVSKLDISRVMNMVVQLTSKWELDIKLTRDRQMKIFEYTQASPVKLDVEVVSTSQTDDYDSDIESQTPCKMAKIDN